jgi:hypothetical protein
MGLWCRRERDLAAKAAAIGHATIRLLMPFGMVVQCEFGPLETLQQMFVFVKHIVLKPSFATKFSLFVTPPKRVFKGKDLEATFWDQGLVPGAYVHVAIDSDILAEGLNTEQASQKHIYKEFLRSEVLAVESDTAPEPERPQRKQAPAGQAPSPRRGGGEFNAAKNSKVASSGKVPKWLKIGK